MIFGHSHLTPDCTLSISNNVILRTNVCKFLGIFIDENLSWSNHIDHTCSKLSKAIGMIKVAQMYMPRAVLMSMFQAFVMSYLRYGVLLWGNTFPTYIYRVRVLFNKAIRAILSVPPTTHMSPLLHKLQVLRLMMFIFLIVVSLCTKLKTVFYLLAFVICLSNYLTCMYKQDTVSMIII